MADKETYRGSALVNALRRAVHPATGDNERLNALRLVHKMDSESRFLLAIDPDLQKYHTADEWRLRVSRLADQIVERDGKIKSLERELEKERRKTTDLPNLRGRIRELEGQLRGRSTHSILHTLSNASVIEQAIRTEIVAGGEINADTGLPFKLFNTDPVQIQIGDRIWDTNASRKLHWTDVRSEMILSLIERGMSVETIKTDHFGAIFPGLHDKTATEKRKYKFHRTANVTIRREDANETFKELREYAVHTHQYFSIIVRFLEKNRITQLGTGEYTNDPALPGKLVRIVQPVNGPLSWDFLHFTFTRENYSVIYKLLHDERLSVPVVANIMRCTDGQIYGKFGNQPLDEHLLGYVVPVRMGFPMDYLELWKVAFPRYGGVWKDKIPQRFGRKPRSLKWDDPKWLSVTDADQLRREYLNL